MQTRSETLPLRGLLHQVRHWGSETAPHVVLLHGFLDVSETFDGLSRLLAERFHVLAPDLRGFGLTEWPQDGYWFPDYLADLDALLEHYSPAQPVFLIGHSMGAQIAATYAGARPERVAKLACLDGLFLARRDPDDTLRHLRLWLRQVRGGQPELSYASYAEFAERLRKLHPQMNDAQADFVARCWARQEADGRVRLRADPRHRRSFPIHYQPGDYQRFWSAVSAPTLFVDGGASGFISRIPEAERLELVALFARAQRVVIADAGHMLHLDAPEPTALHLLAFLAGEE